MIVSEVSYEMARPTIDHEILKLRASGADAIINITSPEFAAQDIRKLAEVGWMLVNVSVSVGTVMLPAGFSSAQGVMSVTTPSIQQNWGCRKSRRQGVACIHQQIPARHRQNPVQLCLWRYGRAHP